MMPGWRDWLFSAKTFAAAMLAFGIALAADLDRPYWTMATVYIASQPLSGATRSKAVFRVVGTLLGATAVLVLVPNLNGSPELLAAAMILWTAGCLSIALLDRTPRSYVFMLAAYTAPIIGFPSVAAPEAVWDTAVSRSEEIILGIVCASLVANLVFPRHVGPVVAGRTGRWLDDVWSWAVEVLEDRDTPARARSAQQRAVTEANEIDTLAAHLVFDASMQQQARGAVDALRARVSMMLPLVSSVADRLTGLRDAGGITPGLRAVLDRTAACCRAGADEDPDLCEAIDALRPVPGTRPSWDDVLLDGLALRLRELVDLRADCRLLQTWIERGGRRPGALRFRPQARASTVRHHDWGMAAASGAAAGLAVGLVCLFWIASAWPEGALAAEMAAIACCFFAAQDDPVPVILSFLRWTAVAVVVDGLYLFAILPMVHDFAMLALVLAPTFLLFGVLIARPATSVAGLALAVIGATEMGLQSSYTGNFVSFANGGVATIAGMAVAAGVTGIVRSVGAEWSALRLMRATWAALAGAAERRAIGDPADLARLLLDRYALVVPRLAVIGPGSALQDGDALRELRIGFNIVDLRGAQRFLPPVAGRALDGVLDGLAGHFRALARRSVADAGPEAPQALLHGIDTATDVVAASPDGTRRHEALLGLVGLRRCLFPDAPPWDPARMPLAAVAMSEHAA